MSFEVVLFCSAGCFLLVITMRGAWIKRLLFLLWATGVILYLGTFLMNGYGNRVHTNKDLDISHVMKRFFDLETQISNLSELSER